jgi:S-adenosylmethionine hydrolase
MNEPSGIVTLLTDFGTQDPFVGVMKGVMLAIERELRIVDLTHGIEPQAIASAAFWLEQSYRWFPAGSVHVVVVDPGVGSERAAVAVRANGHYFVGPDNGCFELVVRRATAVEAHEVMPERLGLSVPSRTFHGRDVFAPVGALIAAGKLELAACGPARALLATERVPEPVEEEDGVRGVVVAVDRFGNLVTNVPAAVVREGVFVELAARRVEVVRAYAEVPVGTLAAVIGSCGTLEFFVRDGSARALSGAAAGARVKVGRANSA